MKIEVNEQKQIVLKEVFDPIIMQTNRGDLFTIYMCNNTIEMTIAGSDKWYRANMDTGYIEEL